MTIIKLQDYDQIHQVLKEIMEINEEHKLKNLILAYEYEGPHMPDPTTVTFFNGRDRVIMLIGLLDRVRYHMHLWLDNYESQ